jgi:hypothetical protein
VVSGWALAAFLCGCGGKVEEPKVPAGKLPSYMERNKRSIPPDVLEKMQKSRQQGGGAQSSAPAQNSQGGQ